MKHGSETETCVLLSDDPDWGKECERQWLETLVGNPVIDHNEFLNTMTFGTGFGF